METHNMLRPLRSLQAVKKISRGLIEACLGGHLVKKRVARTGFGKRGGYRTIVAKKVDQHWFFLFGFEKSDRSNIDQLELRVLQEIGETVSAFTETERSGALQNGELLEIMDGNQKTKSRILQDVHETATG
jgi:hypothetical protein